MKKIIESKWLNYVLIATPYLMMSMSYFSSHEYVFNIQCLILLCVVPVVLYKNWKNKEYFNRLALFSLFAVVIYFYVIQK
jgi:asparagine N-glycosylation enzyme membrane subunit Stt3